MSWVKIDDEFPEHAKVMALNGAGAKWLHVVALCQCASNLTDGFISQQRLKVVCAIADVPRPAHAVKQLVDVGLWDECDGGYMIRSYLDYNPDSETVKEERRRARDRMRAKRGSGERSGEQPAEQVGERSGGSSSSPSRPVPSFEKPKAVNSSRCEACGTGGGLHVADCPIVTEAA